ncbi:MAG: VTT domain-containing protein, partial [Candidatus Latescibacteria bacterium]|nr:VTT domain-containing protein [Candidatus Latescibacterota bacterium]
MKLNRDWQLFLTILGGIAMVCLPAVFLFPSYRNLVILFLCSVPCNSVVGLPNEPITVLFGRYYVPHLVAVVAALGAVVPCFLDYKAINFAFEARRLRSIRESDVYQGACQYFLKAPFAVIFTAAFVPIIPFYIFRVLSPTAGYPLRRYMPAVFL